MKRFIKEVLVPAVIISALFILAAIATGGCAPKANPAAPAEVTAAPTATPAPGSGSGALVVSYSWPNEPSTGCQAAVQLDGGTTLGQNWVECNAASGSLTFGTAVTYGNHSISTTSGTTGVTIVQYIDSPVSTMYVTLGTGCPPAPITENF